MNNVPEKKCNHDLDNPIRKGRAQYECSRCGEDISLLLAFTFEATRHVEKERWEARFDEEFSNVGWIPENKERILTFIARTREEAVAEKERCAECNGPFLDHHWRYGQRGEMYHTNCLLKDNTRPLAMVKNAVAEDRKVLREEIGGMKACEFESDGMKHSCVADCGEDSVVENCRKCSRDRCSNKNCPLGKGVDNGIIRNQTLDKVLALFTNQDKKTHPQFMGMDVVVDETKKGDEWELRSDSHDNQKDV